MIIGGIFMLRGANWARLLYIFWSGPAILIGLITTGFNPGMIFGMIKYAVFLYFLTRKPVVAFFGEREETGLTD